MRLLEGANDMEGRVEVCSGEVWGSICHDFWGSRDAQVVCRQLGYQADGETRFSLLTLNVVIVVGCSI